jgi:diguanylate cyclase (GGDEF)-like protein
MTFRRRLTLYFIAIVALPMIAVAVLVVQVTSDSRDGKADARLDAGLTTVRSLYDSALKAAPRQASRIATEAGQPLRDSDRPALAQIAKDEAGSPGVVSVTITGPDGTKLASAGPSSAIGTGSSAVRLPNGKSVGTVTIGTLTPTGFVDDVKRLTGREAAIGTDDGVLASTTDLGNQEFPDPAADGVSLDAGGSPMRAAALGLNGAPANARLVLLTPREPGFVASEPLVAGILLAFFAVAVGLIALLISGMQRRIGAMLDAARRIGEGDFSREVPVEGNDEMAGLALEFNKMSRRLSAQLSELDRQREELDESVQRLGEAFASGLDRHALLEIVTETAASACDAEAGRVVLSDRPDNPEIMVSDESPTVLDSVLDTAGAAAAANRGAGEASEDGRHAIATAIMDRRDQDAVLCTIAVARRGEPFEPREREVLRYLLRQTVVSIENIGLHERVAEQAVTDDLTGIPNHRRFSEWIEQEVARIARHGGELALILIDIDNFKGINDTYGHLQGDRVLEEIGRVLRIESRGIDLSARYGGEEFVLALPETGTQGAAEVAERLRRRIELTRVSMSPEEDPIEVTASFGVASIPGAGTDARSLISAADDALYHAKRSGKNQVSLSEPVISGPPQGNEHLRRS